MFRHSIEFRPAHWLALFAMMFLSLPTATAADEEPESASDAKSATTSVTGVVESLNVHEVAAETEHITSFKIKRIIPHGTNVSKGQNVVWFETEDVDKKIKESETNLQLERLSLEDAEFKHKQFVATQKLDRAKADRARQQAQQDFDNFVRVDRERQREQAQFNIKSSTASLANAQEELKQLQQMYEEDDLTEESEEIVLKRAKQAVESAEFRLRGTEIQSNRTLNQGIPRSQASQDDALARAQLAFQQSIRDLKSARTKRDIELDRQRRDFKQKEADLAALRQERKGSVLTSPIDGLALHGVLLRGKLNAKPSTLKPGSPVSANQTVITVVDPTKLQIRVDLEEKNLAAVKVGGQCTVTAPALPDFKAIGTVKSVSAVPFAGTKYDCVIKLRGKDQKPLRPTMTCKLEFVDEQGGDDDNADEQADDDEVAEDDVKAKQGK